MNFIKKISKKIKVIDTLTTKLLTLVLFIAIIPLIVTIDFSINIINQNIKDNLKTELNLYKHFYKKQNNFEFNKLETLANINSLNEKNFLLKKNLYNNIDLLGIISKNHSILLEINKYNYKFNKDQNNLINYSLSGKIVKSFELLKGNSGVDLLQIVSIPNFDKNNHITGIKIIGKKLYDDTSILNENKYQIKLYKVTDWQVSKNSIYYKFFKEKTLTKANIISENKSMIQKNNEKIIEFESMKNFDKKIVGIIYFEVKKSSFVKSVQKNAEIIRIISVISLFVSILIAALFSRSITTPILNLVNAAKIISAGNLTHRVKNKGNDEIAKLSDSFNKMAESLLLEKQLKDNFITTLTHDLKVPMLAENQTISYMLKEIYGPITPEQKEILELIRSTNNSSLEMVITLLDVYKYENGQAQLIKSEFNIIKLLKESIEEIKSLALDKKISINIDTPEEEIILYADNREIKRVLHNLISNSIINGKQNGNISCKVDLIDFKCIYYPTNKKNTNTSLLNSIDISNNILISIKDDGAGISSIEIPDLFKRFSPGKGRKPSGTGIGLYYCNQVIAKHKGLIWVESKENEGSEFKFTIPISYV